MLCTGPAAQPKQLRNYRTQISRPVSPPALQELSTLMSRINVGHRHCSRNSLLDNSAPREVLKRGVFVYARTEYRAESSRKLYKIKLSDNDGWLTYFCCQQHRDRN